MKILNKVVKSKVSKEINDLTGNNSKNKKKVKARPSVKKQKEEEERKQKESQFKNPKFKFLNMWVEKLENMHVILTSDEGMRKFDTI